MLEAISWQAYWITVLLASAVYYSILYASFYKTNSKAAPITSEWGRAESSQLSGKEPSCSPRNESGEFDAPEKGTQEHVVYACMDELTAFFEQQRKSKTVKSELLFSLYTILQKYPSLRSSEYRDSITNIMATECEHICSIHLSADELKGVWFG